MSRGLLFILLALGLSVPVHGDSAVASRGFELTSEDTALVVRPQTADEAYQYLVGVLDDMDFFRANGYDVTLPNHPAFAPEASPRGSSDVFAREVYEPAEFESR